MEWPGTTSDWGSSRYQVGEGTGRGGMTIAGKSLERDKVSMSIIEIGMQLTPQSLKRTKSEGGS